MKYINTRQLILDQKIQIKGSCVPTVILISLIGTGSFIVYRLVELTKKYSDK